VQIFILVRIYGYKKRLCERDRGNFEFVQSHL